MSASDPAPPPAAGTGRVPGGDLPLRAPTPMRSSRQVLVSVVVGLVSGVAALLGIDSEYAPLAGWDVAALVYIVWVWTTIRGCSAEETARLAVREDPPRFASDVLLSGAAVASLITVGVVLNVPNGAGNVVKLTHGAAAVASVLVSWTLVHTIHTLAYARVYYTDDDGGVDFNTGERPRFDDFAYLAYTIGMTFQVSDTPLTSAAMRRVALRHALLSYLFGAVIIATAINFIVTLSSK